MNLSLLEKQSLLRICFIIGFLFSMHFAIPNYVTSSLLANYFGTQNISTIYIVAATITLFISFQISKLIRRFHNYTLALIVIVLGFISTISIAFSNNGYLTAILYILHFIFASVLLSIINLFVEEFEDSKKAGQTRGLLLTIMSVGTIFSPLITGILLKTYGFASAYILSAILIVPIFFLIKHYYHNVNDPKYKKVSMFKGIIRIILDKNLRAVTLSMLMLQCFYSLIVIYAPLYLATFWEIPIYQYTSYILPFALIPFLIIPYETGIISDKYLGEKEMMITGYLIMAISTLLFPFVKGGLIIFALYLFLTRIGASMLDSMNYSYFFKKVHHDDVTSIVLFNNLHLLSNILMPFLALLTIYLTGDMRYLFIIYGIIALAVLPQIFKMKDTK